MGKKIRNYHEKNLLLIWSIILGVSFLSLFVYLIFMIEFDILRNPEIVTDTHLKIVLFIVSFVLSSEITRIANKMLAYFVNRGYLSRFNHLKEFRNYKESIETFSFSEKKYDHVVLLLHGFSASPKDFEDVFQILKDEKIDYFSPNILGFGLDNTNLLSNVSHNDWYRTVLNTYDALTSISNKVTVVGHSMGGLLALYIACNRNVSKLILTSPGYSVNKKYIKYKILLMIPVISHILIFLFPHFPKDLDQTRGHVLDVMDSSSIDDVFHYLAVPTRSIKEVFLMQKSINLKLLKFDSLHILYGKYDNTVNVNKILHKLKISGHSFSSYVFENSAHNLFQDYDHNACVNLIKKIITDEVVGNLSNN